MTGAGWTTFGSYGGGINQFYAPTGIAVDAKGRIYIADQLNHRIVRINNMTGAGWTTFGTQGSDTNQFALPYGIAVDSSGYIYVGDFGNHWIVKFTMP